MSNELQSVLDDIKLDKQTNLKPENIKKDITVLGVTGTLEDLDTSDATATASDILQNKTAYVNGEKLTGTMPNNGELNYTPSTESQSIPAGYTSGGIIAASSITSEEYDECLNLANQIAGNGGN